MSVKVSKRNTSLCISTKIEIIQRLRNGETISDLSRIYNVPRTTISTFKQNGGKMEDFMNKIESSDGVVSKRKRLKTASNTLLDEIMFHWYLQQKSFGLHVNGPMLTQKALTVNSQLKGDPNFKASSGWLDKFKSRHGIRFNCTENDKTDFLSSSNDENEIRIKEEIDDSYEEREITVQDLQNVSSNVTGSHNDDKELIIEDNTAKYLSTTLEETNGIEISKKKTSISSILTHKEVEVMLGKCIDWYEKQEESRPSEIMLLNEIRTLAEAKSREFTILTEK